MTATETFAAWGLALDEIPLEVARAASRHILDGIGCALAAARLGTATPAVDVAVGLGGAPEAAILGTDMRVSAPAAALANGALIHALDFDDTHTGALVHATAAVLPAALAAGEAARASGADLLAACVAGYEMVARLGAAVPHGFHARGFHATSVCGVFAGTLAAARLSGLDEEQTVNALGIAGSLASGSLEFLTTGSSTKRLHPGLAGMNALTAVRLAAAGADGPAWILEGRYGLFASFLGVEVDAATLTEGLGVRWETRQISIKPFPACQLSTASLDAFRRATADVDAASIARAVFSVPEGVASIVCEPAADKRQPRTPYDAKFSLPFCAATLAVDGHLDLRSFEEASLAREGVRALAARISHEVVPFDGAPADAPGAVTVTMSDGREIVEWVHHASGTPGAPVSDDDLVSKFVANAWGNTATRLADDILGLASLPGLAPVVRAP